MVSADGFVTEIGDFEPCYKAKTELSTGIHKCTSTAMVRVGLPLKAHDFTDSNAQPAPQSTLRSQPDSEHPAIRFGSDSDPTAESGVGSNVRTDVRTYASDHYGYLSGLGSRRTRAYRKADSSGVGVES